MEENCVKLLKLVSRMDFEVTSISDNLVEIEREWEICMSTNNKYTDSSRINNTPQRFLTQFLRVRLKDHLDHETVTNNSISNNFTDLII